MAPKARSVTEASLYPVVEKWMNRKWGCFASKKDTGTKLGRIDVAGVRDIGGDLSGQSEVIAIEVKAGTQVFTTAAGQAFGYSVYANRVYLADYRPVGKEFSEEEIAIAGRLGIGLLLIRPNNRINLVQTSPFHEPIEALRRRVLFGMDLATCSVCDSVFSVSSKSGGRGVSAEGSRPGAMQRAVRAERGYVWSISETAWHDSSGRDNPFHRRYLCWDCASGLFRDFTPDAT